METVLITGGAGFVGSNLAERLLSVPGIKVRIFDNLSRRGVLHNLSWLKSLAKRGRLEIVEGDIRDAEAVRRSAKDATEVYHLAAQVAVTTSVDDPAGDFQTNAMGTLNVLEAARMSGMAPFVLFTSTNKVYGSLEGVPVAVEGTRYKAQPGGLPGSDGKRDAGLPFALRLAPKVAPISMCATMHESTAWTRSSSACPASRGHGSSATKIRAGLRIFCTRCCRAGTITVCGDGYQVRDILHVHDLVERDDGSACRTTDSTWRGLQPGRRHEPNGFRDRDAARVRTKNGNAFAAEVYRRAAW